VNYPTNAPGKLQYQMWGSPIPKHPTSRLGPPASQTTTEASLFPARTIAGVLICLGDPRLLHTSYPEPGALAIQISETYWDPALPVGSCFACVLQQQQKKRGCGVAARGRFENSTRPATPDGFSDRPTCK
jgi:hypothetical protein